MGKNNNAKYFVSRQEYYYSGIATVEIAIGGRDYAGADMLSNSHWFTNLGCNQEYCDPLQALEAGLKVQEAWQAIVTAKTPGREVFISMGNTGGMGMELEPMTHEELEALVQKLHDQAPKCDFCGDTLTSEGSVNCDFEDEIYCSERCVENSVADLLKKEIINVVQEQLDIKLPEDGKWNVQADEEAYYVSYQRGNETKIRYTLDLKTLEIQ